MRQGKQCQKRIVGVLLALALVFDSLAGLVPGTQMTAKAAVDKKFNLGDRVTIDEVAGREWYVIKQDSTSVTLLATKCFKECRFGITSNYSSSYIKKDLGNLKSGELAGIKSVLCEDPRLLTANEAEHIRKYRKSVLKCGQGHYWWTQTASGAKNEHVRNILVRCVQGDFAWVQKVEDGKPTMGVQGMRPAIQLDLSKVFYDDERKAFYTIPEPPDPVEALQAVINKYPTPKYSLIENGELQDLLERDGEVENGTMVYTLTDKEDPTQQYLDSLPDRDWSTDIPQAKEAKTYCVCFKAKGTRDDVSYYEDSPAEYVLVKIMSKEEAEKASVTEWPEAKLDIIANGQAQELVKAGRAENGEMLYALGTDSDTAPEEKYFSASIPKGTDVGLYYVWFMAKATAGTGYVDSEPAFVVAEILNPEEVEKEKKSEVTKDPKPKNKVIPNGQPQELVTPGTGTQGIMVYALGHDAVTPPPPEAFSESIPKATDPGTYYVWFRIKGDEGFIDTDPVCVVIVIRDSAVTPTSVPDNTPEAATPYSSSSSSSGYFGSFGGFGGFGSSDSSGSGGGGKRITVLSGGRNSSRGYYIKLSKNTVEYYSPKLKKNAKTAMIPATIKVDKRTYKVTAISPYAFVDSNLQSVTIGKNVKRISPYAFFGANKLKTIKLATKQLTAKKIKDCLKGSNVDKVIVLEKAVSKLGLYKKIFTKKITGAANKLSVKKQK